MTKSLWIAALIYGLPMIGTLPATAFAAETTTPSPADARFAAIYTAEWTWRKALTGDNDDDSGDTAIRAHFPDVSEKTQQAKLVYWQDVLRRLDAIDPKDLSAEQQVDYTVYRNQIDTLIAQQTFHRYEMAFGFWNGLSYAARKPMRSEQDYRNYIAYLNDVPRYFQQNIDNMRAGLKRGFTPAQVSLQGRDASVASVFENKAVEDTVFYTPFLAMPAGIPAATQTELKRLAVDAIRNQVIPAHQALLTFLRKDYIPGARTTIAAYDLPDGKAYYQALIREYVTLDLTPDQIHQTGLDEVAKIRTEMQAVMDQVGFKGTLQDFNSFLRGDPQFYAKTPQAFLDRAAWISKEFDGKAGQYFGRAPRMRFGIVPTPDAIAPFNTGGNGGPGVLILNTYDLPSRPLYTLPSLVLHEGAPGHAWQMPLALENSDLPAFRRSTYISAFGEGWALYSERLGDEMGMYHTPYDRFGMLTYQMWRACRLVVDTGMHAKGWTRAQAIAYLRENTALSEHEITTETDRYITTPGQALSYYIGEMTIWQARHKAEAALGERFDIRAFHDTVLQLGSVPMPVLQARIDRFIAEGGRGPYAQ